MELTSQKKLEIGLVLSTPAMWVAPIVGLDADVLHGASSFEAESRRIYAPLSAALGYDYKIFDSEQNTKNTNIARPIPEFSTIMSLSKHVNLVLPLIKNHKPGRTGLATVSIRPLILRQVRIGTRIAFSSDELKRCGKLTGSEWD